MAQQIDISYSFWTDVRRDWGYILYTVLDEPLQSSSSKL